MEHTCSACHEALKEGEPSCHMDSAAMHCENDMCTCPTCGNAVAMTEVKCRTCLGM